MIVKMATHPKIVNKSVYNLQIGVIFQLSAFVILQILSLLLTLTLTLAQNHLSVIGKNLTLNGEKVFLSGVNQAWVHYAMDFGNGGYNNSRTTLYKTLDAIRMSGGNSIRMWVHCGGESTPQFNSSGYVTGLDRYVLGDLSDFLQGAQDRNILVNLCLWNGAIKPGVWLQGLIMDDRKLQSYIDNALIPIVKVLTKFRSLGSYEVMNEPEGLLAIGHFSFEPCYDTLFDPRPWDFADWTGASLPMQRLLKFISLQANAIHINSPQSLVTVGSWTYKTLTTRWYRSNFYSDHCLKLAGGNEKGNLDFYQIHTYDTLHHYFPNDPFNKPASTYEMDKPVIIGEFSQTRGGGMTSPEQFYWAYSQGYSGSWSWCAINSDSASDNLTVQEKGMEMLRNRNNQSLGGRVNISLNNNYYEDASLFGIRIGTLVQLALSYAWILI